MQKHATGRRVFTVLGVALWLLAIWLFVGADGSKTRSTLAFAAGFAALVMTAHALLFAKFGDRKDRLADWFRQHCRPVEVEIVKIGRRDAHRAWRIKARHLDRHGNEITYKSDMLGDDPNDRWKVGDGITVYLDPANPRRYWMDTGIASKNL